MTFHVGQKVVCVDGSEHSSCECSGAVMPVAGKIYTIREIRINPRSGIANFHLHEIHNDLVLSEVDGLGEPYFSSTRFRPIIERKTDISIFTAMLNPSQVAVDALNTADFAREFAQ